MEFFNVYVTHIFETFSVSRHCSPNLNHLTGHLTY